MYLVIFLQGPHNLLIFRLKTMTRLILIHAWIIADNLPKADLSYSTGRLSSSNKLEQDLNPYFTYQPVARLRWSSERRGEAEEARRVLNLKVKPLPLLPNPRAEREGCSAPSSHSTDLNGPRSFATAFLF